MNEQFIDSNSLLNKKEILSEFISSQLLAGRSEKTIQNYSHTINQLNDFIDNNEQAKNQGFYSLESIELFFRYGILERNWSKYTIWTKYKNLNPFFKWCEQKRKVNKNPLSEMVKPKMPLQAPKALNESEVNSLIEAVMNFPTQYRFTKLRNIAIIFIILYTGIRRKELLDLRVEDVDMLNGFIRIEHGKGDKYREIPIEQKTLKPALISYLDYRHKLNKTSQWFFNGTFGNHSKDNNKLTASAIDRLFRQLREMLNYKISAHRLRHTFATFLLDNTGDIYTLKELMGHTKISTTCIYLKSTRKKKVEAINSISFV
ncbi:MAG: tyrosine-type recombinase/integrase [Patescibacteria group bacterium]